LKLADLAVFQYANIYNMAVYMFKDILKKTTSGQRLLLPVPVSVGLLQAALLELVVPQTSPLRITQDQVRLLQEPNIVHGSTLDSPVTFCRVDSGADEQTFKEMLVGAARMHALDDVYAAGIWKPIPINQ
jgi:hypothetical protein